MFNRKLFDPAGIVRPGDDLSRFEPISDEAELSKVVFTWGDNREGELVLGWQACDLLNGWMLIYGGFAKRTAFGLADDLHHGTLSLLRTRVLDPMFVVFTRHSLDCENPQTCTCREHSWWAERAADYTVPGAVCVTPVLPRRRWLPQLLLR